MKANQSCKSRNIKKAIRILTIFVCIGIAFSLVVVEQSEALFGILLVIGAVFVGGVLIGWWTAGNHDSSSPDALITSEENYVLVWNDFVEGWNNDYIDENTDLQNYMMMYNLTYLDSVRRAEHDVASYVHLTSWSNVESNMTTLIGYKENITKFIISTLHGYNRIDVSILQHLYDTDIWSYTTPMKYGVYAHHSTGEIGYAHAILTDYGYIIPDDMDLQYKVNFGTYPIGFNSGGGIGGIPLRTGGYNISDKFYVTYIYVPNGNFITLNDLDSNEETTYYHGVYDLEGKRNEVIDVTLYDLGSAYANERLDRTGVYLFGVPTDFDMFDETFITYNTRLNYSSEPQSILFEKSKFIKTVTIVNDDFSPSTIGVELYIDGVYIDKCHSSNSLVVIVDDYGSNITTIPFGGCKGYPRDIKTMGYIFHDTVSYLKVLTEHAGNVYITDNLTARGKVGLDWMVSSYKNIYDSMIIQAKILWNLYHANGWYSTDDIPSEFLVVPPDIIFDNMDALQNLPLDKAQAIYYTWMKQLIDFYDENPDYTGTYNDSDMTVFDDGIIFNATLIHGNKTIFTNHLIYISPLLEDLYLCKNESYTLTQKIFIYDITGNYVYYGYVDDNLTIQNITIQGAETDCITLGRQTMHDFLLGKYGFSISFPAEWVFPTIENAELYMGIAIACFGFGIPIAIFGKKYRPIGYLLIVIGSGIIIYVYVIPAIQSFIDFIIFWD